MTLYGCVQIKISAAQVEVEISSGSHKVQYR